MDYIYRVHAIQRMFQRRISKKDIQSALQNYETIEFYPQDIPYPSRLALGWCGSRPLHVVFADNYEDNERIIITAYEPDLDQWEKGFKRRKQ